MNHYTALAVLTALLSAPTLLVAGPPQGPPDFDRGANAEHRPVQRLERMIEFLDLSETQAVQIETLLAEQRQARQETFDTMRAVRDQLQTLLDTEAPDATTVGEKAIELHRLRRAMQAEGEQQVTAIREVLTAKQAEKLDTLLEVREMGRPDRPGHERDRRGRPGPHDRRPVRG